MSEHPINDLMDTTMQKIKEMVDVDTIIGKPITAADGTTIIPVSKVSYGFASGGSDFPSKKEGKDCFGGGSGAGVSISPIGFLVIANGDVKMVTIENYSDSTDRIVGMVPEVIDKITGIFKKDKKNADTEEIKLDDPIV